MGENIARNMWSRLGIINSPVYLHIVGYFHKHITMRGFMNVTFKMKFVSERHCRENQNTYFMYCFLIVAFMK
jgi:hypothetical protein